MSKESIVRKYGANKIKSLRESNLLSQDELADKLSKLGQKKVTRQAISLYETGARRINQDLIFDLSNVFNVPISTFFPNIEKESEKIKVYTILDEKDVKIDIELKNDYDLTPDIINQALDELYKIKLNKK